MSELPPTASKIAPPVTIYVESRLDAALYELLCGSPKISGLLFKEPGNQHIDRGGGQGGFRSVRNATLADRAACQGRPTSFGLLDGEESSRFGQGTELFTNSQIVFSMDDPRTDGLLFLGCYEKEGLYLRHGNAIKLMKNRLISGLRASKLKSDSISIDPAFDTSIRASIAKCAAKPIIANLRYWVLQKEANELEAKIFKAINYVVYGERSPIAEIFDCVKSLLPNYTLREEFSQRVRGIYSSLNIDPSMQIKLTTRNGHLTAICDAKAMFDLVMHRDQNYSFEDMAAELLDIGFGTEFRSAVQAAISGKAIHVSRNSLNEEFNKRELLAFRLMDKMLL